MAKDVTNFLSWAAEPEHDERKKIGIKAVILFSALTALSIYVKRFKWNVIKNRKIGESRNVMSIVDQGLTECALVYNPPVDKTH